MGKLPLHWKIIIGLVLGILWALASSWLGWGTFTENWVSPWGRIFIDLLKLIAVPLVLFSIIGGIVSLGHPRDLGRLGGKTLLFYLATTVISVTVGLVLVNVLAPGKTIEKEVRLENRMGYELWLQEQGLTPKDGRWFSRDSTYHKLLSQVAQKRGFEETEEVRVRLETAQKAEKDGPLVFLEDMVPGNLFFSLSDNRNMLQIIFFGIFFGVALLFIPSEKAAPLKRLIDSVAEVFLKMVELIMAAAPFFVFALMAGMVNQMSGGDPGHVLELFKGLTWYSLVVVLGLVIMAFVIYPAFMAFFVKGISFMEFLRGISPAQMLAFTTSSSAATLPVTLECVEENLKVDKRISSFVLPIGATVNMDGTSLYQAVAVVFLAQMHLVDLSIGQQLTVVLTATLASIGAAAIPSAGVVMLMVVLSSVGLNPAWIGIILPVDRILDMMRTVVNVTGDATVSVVVGKTTNLDNIEQ
ncbi:dicarboxylate/amino acid:cation symporter [Marinilabilia salmonicolor]|uniref:Na+/H+-dicarboxylate symporter n=1 Tax=Marinilabilia salmonicolor TaxID=989 RepID=A0A368UJA0_9BACT|nr:dicarboxylate/amino acid:cation symporter [Marinilabilia salmonicolor]RCW27493.1 Na+/H+-dicarboxylate symporter [Marinilabilia salmonicolor]